MRLLFALLLISTVHAEWIPGHLEEKAVLPGGAKFIEREVRNGDRAMRVLGVIFSSRQGRFEILDNPTSGSGKLDEAAAAAGAIAGVNGGYFHPDWKPVGLAISGGRILNGFEKAKLLSGVFVVTKDKPRLLRSAEYKASKNDQSALQAGPFLVDGGKPTLGLNSSANARRTVVATDGSGNWAILYLTLVSLAEAGEILATDGLFPGFEIDRALNLDGGSSSAIWVATEPKPFYLREIGSVRNYLVILPR